MAIEKSKRGRPKKSISEKKRHIYTIRIDDDLDKALKRQAKAENTTITEIARKSLIEYLKKAKQWDANQRAYIYL